MKPIKITLKYIISALVGITFLVSAIAKLISIDNFEIYIYSFNILSFNLTSLFSRGIIFFELVLGLLLLLRVQYRITYFVTLLTLMGFTLFLSTLAFSGNQDNCQCFGSLVELDPLNSIFKNLILLALLFLSRDIRPFSFKFKNHIVIALSTIAFIVCFVILPPDFLYNKFVSKERKMDEISFVQLKNDSTIQTISVHEGKKIVAFYVSGCQFCKLGMKKIDAIFTNNNLDKSHFNIIIAGEPNKAIEKFNAVTSVAGYPIVQVPKELVPTFMKTVQGAFPTFLFLEDGKIVKSIDFRGINDSEITTFLQ